mgnify:CR=1 FL=1
MAEIPNMSVPRDWTLYPRSGLSEPNCVTTQKYESLACDTVMAAIVTTNNRMSDKPVIGTSFFYILLANICKNSSI